MVFFYASTLTNEQTHQYDGVSNKWTGRQHNGVRLSFGQRLVVQYHTGDA